MGVRHTETNIIIWSAAAVADEPHPQPTAAITQSEPISSIFGADKLYDAGDLGCAFGPMDDIAGLMRKMESAQTLEIRASDPTVAVDLAAWCRMTGHTLVEQRGDRFLVKHN